MPKLLLQVANKLGTEVTIPCVFVKNKLYIYIYIYIYMITVSHQVLQVRSTKE